MSRFVTVVLILLTGLALLAAACARPAAPSGPAPTQASKPPVPAAAAKPVELKFNVFTPATHSLYTYVLKPWTDELEKRTGGRVKVIPFFSGALAKQEEDYDATVRGTSDISLGTQRSTPGRFSLSELIYLPGLGLPDPDASTLALAQVYKTFAEVREQYNATRVLLLLGGPPRVIGTTKKPVRTLDDLRGLKIWVSGKIPSNMMKALGASPVTMGAGEVYMSMDKGILDGVGWGASGITGNRLEELVKYVTDIPLDCGGWYFVMNKSTDGRLPADVQKILDEMSGDWGSKFAATRYGQAEAAEWEVIRKKGIEIITPSAAEKARWNKAIEPVAEEEVAALEAKGSPARKVYAELLRFSREYKK